MSDDIELTDFAEIARQRAIQRREEEERLQARRSTQKEFGSEGDTENYEYEKIPKNSKQSFADFYNRLEPDADLYRKNWYYIGGNPPEYEPLFLYMGSKADYKLDYNGEEYGLRRIPEGAPFIEYNKGPPICVQRPKVNASSSIGGKRRKKTLNKRKTPKRSKKSRKSRKTKRRRH